MKKTKSRIIILAVLTTLLLVLSTIWAEADDNYNFYFQKAPGPTVVNQGTQAPAAAPNSLLPAGVAPAIVPGSIPVAASVSPQQPAPVLLPSDIDSGYRKWEFSLGYSMAKGMDGNDPSVRAHDNFNAINGQYALGLQFNIVDSLGVFGEYLIARNPSQYQSATNYKQGKQIGDWGLGVAVTPWRFRLDSALSLSVSGLLGKESVPVQRLKNTTPWYPDEGTDYSLIGHESTFFYGARVALDIDRKIALRAEYRKLTSITNGSQMLYSLAYLF